MKEEIETEKDLEELEEVDLKELQESIKATESAGKETMRIISDIRRKWNK